jgi:hypothetical protein
MWILISRMESALLPILHNGSAVILASLLAGALFFHLAVVWCFRLGDVKFTAEDSVTDCGDPDNTVDLEFCLL